MKKLMNQRWFIALVFMVLYKPAMFSQMPALHTFDTISKVSLFFVGIVFFEVWRVLATIYCGGNYTSLFIAILNALAICLVVEMGLKTDPDALLDGASFTLGLFVLINFATVLLFPQGMYEFNTFTQNYFLGYRNNSIMLFFPAIIFSIVQQADAFVICNYCGIVCHCNTCVLGNKCNRYDCIYTLPLACTHKQNAEFSQYHYLSRNKYCVFLRCNHPQITGGICVYYCRYARQGPYLYGKN